MNSANCPFCKGAQWLYETDGEVLVPVRCRCLERKLLHDFLGPEIASAKKLESPLYRPTVNEAGEVEGDRTEENLFLKGPWSLVCQHLRWVLSGKRLYSQGFRFKIVTNEKLFAVWIGNESYKSRSTEIRNDIETNNRMNDVLEDPTLVILRLDGLVHPNKASANVLLEAIKVREFVYKPLWLVENDRYFGPGHPSYNDEVGDYIQERFAIVDLAEGTVVKTKATQAIDSINASVTAALEDGEVSMGLDVETPRPSEITPLESKERFFAEPGSMHQRGHKHRPGGWRKKKPGLEGL